jgi:5-methylcytosine-specific restriction endonuclease McrA
VLTAILIAMLVSAPACPAPARSRTVVERFKKDNPCPKSCRTYVNRAGRWTLYELCGACEVDHVCPLACCGPDTVANMQWLDKHENRAKGADCSKCGG